MVGGTGPDLLLHVELKVLEHHRHKDVDQYEGGHAVEEEDVGGRGGAAFRVQLVVLAYSCSRSSHRDGCSCKAPSECSSSTR